MISMVLSKLKGTAKTVLMIVVVWGAICQIPSVERFFIREGLLHPHVVAALWFAAIILAVLYNSYKKT